MSLQDRDAALDDGAAKESSDGDTITATRTSPLKDTSKQRKRPLRVLAPVKRSTIWVHRWISLVLGLLLLVITTSGALVVYAPEWTRWTNGSAFHVTDSANRLPAIAAIDVVAKAHPEFKPTSVNVYNGLYEVFTSNEGDPSFYGVDPGTGRITGHVNPNRGVMAFMLQVHECFFTCDDYPGYVPFLNDHVPTLGMHWLVDMTWGSFLLGVSGLMLIFLGVSGIWLWWPTFKRFSHGFRIRWKKGRYARDYDLHQVVGMAALPFLLMWGLTGASFEFHWVSTAWYAVTGGHNVPEETFVSNPVKDKQATDITLAAAAAAAQSKAGADAKIAYVSLPAPDDPEGAYNFYFARDFDQYSHGAYPGQYGVDVDRHDASRAHVLDLGTAPTLSNKLLDSWGGALLHYGQSVNGWWRLFWFTFGLTPLILAITGLSTWLAKRGVRKRKKRATAASLASAAAASP